MLFWEGAFVTETPSKFLHILKMGKRRSELQRKVCPSHARLACSPGKLVSFSCSMSMVFGFISAWELDRKTVSHAVQGFCLSARSGPERNKEIRRYSGNVNTEYCCQSKLRRGINQNHMHGINVRTCT